MTAGILIIAIVTLIGVLTHRRSRFEQKIFKNVPLNDWMTMLIFPTFIYIGWATIVKSILDRPNIAIIPLDDFDILAVTILFMIYGFVGNGIHFTSKIVWRYLDSKKNTMAYRVNEMFHNKLSHYLAYVNGLFIAFLMPILEINHPAYDRILSIQLMIIILAGMIFGVSGAKVIFNTNEWFGGYNKPLAIFVIILLSIILAIVKSYRLNMALYPVSLFVTVIFSIGIMTYIVRQLLIFSRLKSKRRLRILSRILSA